MAKKFIFSENDLKTIEVLAGQGMNEEDIANYFSINPGTLSRKKKEYPQLDDAIKKGKSKGKALIVGKLFSKAKEGNLTAIIFYLKTQCGWREADRLTDNHGKFDPARLTDEERVDLFERMPYEMKIKILDNLSKNQT